MQKGILAKLALRDAQAKNLQGISSALREEAQAVLRDVRKVLAEQKRRGFVSRLSATPKVHLKLVKKTGNETAKGS